MSTQVIIDIGLEKPPAKGPRHAMARRPSWTMSLVRNYLPLPLAVAGVGSWWASLSSIHPYEATAVGLVAQLSFLWWLGVALSATAIVVELRRDTPRPAVMVFVLAAFALILHGTLPATEPVPRFSAAYVVAGFSDYIGRTGRALPRLDVRMSWPAMFAAAGMAARAMGVSTLWFLRWCPLVLNLAMLVPLKSIANTCLRTPRARWAVLAIFLLANWIDQDYFSPQGINLFLFLAAVAIVVRVFAVGGYPPLPVRMVLDSTLWLRLKQFSMRALQLPYGAVDNEQPETGTTVRQRIATLAVLLGICATSAVTHQITPAALCLVFFGLAVTGRTNLRMLWILMAVLVWAWLSWEAHTYWSNHLSKVLGSAGQVGSTLNTTVGARLKAKSFGRSLVEYGCLLAAFITWFGAMAGTWALWRRGRTMWTMVIVAVAPVVVAGAVSYGGEVALRILLFSLAPAAVLIASIIDYDRVRRGSALLCAGICISLLILFPLARYGNEIFEAISPGDLAAATWIHVHVPDGSVVYIADRDQPLNYAKVGAYKLKEFGGLQYMTVAELQQHLPVTHVPTYALMTRSEDQDGSDYLGDPPNWLNTFATQLEKTGLVHVVYQDSTAVVLRIEKAAPNRHPKPKSRPHPKPAPVTPHPRPAPTHKPKPAPVIHPKHTTTTTKPKTPKPPTSSTTTTTTAPPTPPPSIPSTTNPGIPIP